MASEKQSEPAHKAPGGTRRAVALALFAIVVLGAGLRLYRLDEQSIWRDEYLTICNVQAQDLWTSLRLTQMNVPEQAAGPLYYVIQYYWAQYVGMHETVLRLLPLLVSMAAIPLLYLFGSYLYGRGVGLVAALCLAMSPQHIWHAQEPRPYSLLTPLLIVALYAMLRALREKRLRWWWVHFAANTLLLFTHVLAAQALVVEGCFLLLFLPRPVLRRVFAWASIQMLLLVPWILWFFSANYYNDHLGADVNPVSIFHTILGNDIVANHSDLLPTWKTNPPDVLSAWTHTLLFVRRGFDAALLFVFCGSVLCFLAAGIRGLVDHLRKRPVDGDTSETLQNTALLSLLLVLPVLLLGALGYVTNRPVFGPMYAMYNTVALYLAIGFTIMRLKPQLTRIAAVALLSLLYAYQLALVLPEVTRTDWRHTATHILDNAAPGDLVLDLQSAGPGNWINYYLEDTPFPARRIATMQAACEEAAAFFRDSPREPGGTGDPRSVWFVASQVLTIVFPEVDPIAVMEQGLTRRGLQSTHRIFRGHYNIVVHRIRPAPGEAVITTSEPVGRFMEIDCGALLDDLGLAYEAPADQEEALAALRRTVPIMPFPCTFFVFGHSLDLLEDGHADLAEAMARKALERDPDFGLGHLALGLALTVEGDAAAARQTFQRMAEVYPWLGDFVGPFVHALFEERDFDHAEAEVKKMEKNGFIVFARALHTVCRRMAEKGRAPHRIEMPPDK